MTIPDSIQAVLDRWFGGRRMGYRKALGDQQPLCEVLVMLEMQQCNAVPVLSFLLQFYDAPRSEREAAARDLWKKICRLSPDEETRQSLLRVVCGPFYGPQLAEWLAMGPSGEGRMDDYLLLAKEAQRRWINPDELVR